MRRDATLLRDPLLMDDDGCSTQIAISITSRNRMAILYIAKRQLHHHLHCRCDICVKFGFNANVITSWLDHFARRSSLFFCSYSQFVTRFLIILVELHYHADSFWRSMDWLRWMSKYLLTLIIRRWWIQLLLIGNIFTLHHIFVNLYSSEQSGRC